MSDCNGGMFCDGTRAMTAKERREYNATVDALGGERSAAGKKWINAQHEKFKAGQRAHRRDHH